MTLSVTTGSVVDLDNATDISAKSANVTVSNGSFGTSANAIVTSVDELTVSTASQNGDIFVTETNGLSNLSLSAGTGNVTLTLNDGSVVDTDGSEDISAKSANVTVSNGAFGTGSNSITTNVDVLLVDTTGANGDQFIKEVSGLTGLNLNAKNGNITLTAGGSIVDTDSDLDIQANVATITANGDVGTANAINTSVGTLSVTTGPAAGGIKIQEASDVIVSKLSTANGSISLLAEGNVDVPNSGDGVVVSGTGNIS